MRHVGYVSFVYLINSHPVLLFVFVFVHAFVDIAAVAVALI